MKLKTFNPQGLPAKKTLILAQIQHYRHLKYDFKALTETHNNPEISPKYSEVICKIKQVLKVLSVVQISTSPGNWTFGRKEDRTALIDSVGQINSSVGVERVLTRVVDLQEGQGRGEYLSIPAMASGPENKDFVGIRISKYVLSGCARRKSKYNRRSRIKCSSATCWASVQS